MYAVQKRQQPGRSAKSQLANRASRPYASLHNGRPLDTTAVDSVLEAIGHIQQESSLNSTDEPPSLFDAELSVGQQHSSTELEDSEDVDAKIKDEDSAEDKGTIENEANSEDEGKVNGTEPTIPRGNWVRLDDLPLAPGNRVGAYVCFDPQPTAAAKTTCSASQLEESASAKHTREREWRMLIEQLNLERAIRDENERKAEQRRRDLPENRDRYHYPFVGGLRLPRC